jgi:SAM-dependent methyltransferase
MPREWYPWWFNYFFDNPLRRLFQGPEDILGPWVEPGMRALAAGCGMGFLAIPMARLVGEGGSVVAVDVRQRVLAVLRRRAERAGVERRITTHCGPTEELNIRDPFDFGLAFWSLHTMDDPARAGRRLAAHLEPGGPLLVAEPLVHVTRGRFEALAFTVLNSGFEVAGLPEVPLSHAALLRRSAP